MLPETQIVLFLPVKIYFFLDKYKKKIRVHSKYKVLKYLAWSQIIEQNRLFLCSNVEQNLIKAQIYSLRASEFLWSQIMKREIFQKPALYLSSAHAEWAQGLQYPDISSQASPWEPPGGLLGDSCPKLYQIIACCSKVEQDHPSPGTDSSDVKCVSCC